MAQLREIYQCEVCGNVVEVVNNSQGELVCCGKAMTKLEAKTEDTGGEKHIPVVEDMDGVIKIKVGSIEHPMAEDHYIKFIEVLTQNRVCRAELNPGQVPEAEFPVKKKDIVGVREFCTIHGLWKN